MWPCSVSFQCTMSVLPWMCAHLPTALDFTGVILSSAPHPLGTESFWCFPCVALYPYTCPREPEECSVLPLCQGSGMQLGRIQVSWRLGLLENVKKHRCSWEGVCSGKNRRPACPAQCIITGYRLGWVAPASRTDAPGLFAVAHSTATSKQLLLQN